MMLISKKIRVYSFMIAFAMWISMFAVLLMGEVKDPIILQHADVLQGSETAAGPVRELRGNVSLSQGNVSVQCDYALQNVNQNSVEMSGNVIIHQGQLTLKMPTGSYDGFSKLAKGRGGVEINDRGKILKALYGDYNTENSLARFFGNVRVEDDSSLIHADSVYYERSNRSSTAFGNVSVLGKYTRAIVDGEIAYNVPDEGLTRIIGRPNLYLIDSTLIADTIINTIVKKSSIPSKESLKKSSKKPKKTIPPVNEQIAHDTVITVNKFFKYDTMTVIADTLESFQMNENMFYANSNVEMTRKGMSALCSHARLYSNTDSISLYGSPVIWYDSTQLSAETIVLDLEYKKLKKIDALGSAFAIMRDDTIRKNRAQQISGKNLEVLVINDTIQQIIASNDAKSLYFRLDEEGLPDGAAKNSSDSIKVLFNEGQPESIVWLGGVQGDVYPENLVIDRESEYDLPGKPKERIRPQKKQRRHNHSNRH